MFIMSPIQALLQVTLLLLCISAVVFSTETKCKINPGINTAASDSVTKEEVCSKLNDDSVLFVDVRRKYEFRSIPKIESADWLHLKLSDLNPFGRRRTHPLEMENDEFEEKYDHAKPSPADEIIIYCRSGARSNNALKIFRKHGYTNVKHFPGSAGYWKCLKQEGFCPDETQNEIDE